MNPAPNFPFQSVVPRVWGLCAACIVWCALVACERTPSSSSDRLPSPEPGAHSREPSLAPRDRSSAEDDVPAKSAVLPLLRAFEAELGEQLDPAAYPPSQSLFGPDPYRVQSLGQLAVGLHRGSSQVVLLDEAGHVLSRAAAPRSPRALAVDDAGRIFVGAEFDRRVGVYQVHDRRLQQRAWLELPQLAAVTALAVRDGRLQLIDEWSGAWRSYALPRQALDGSQDATAPGTRVLGQAQSSAAVHGPAQLLALPGAQWALVGVVDHELGVWEQSGESPPRRLGHTLHDGPVWGMAASSDADGSWLVLGGVEDHPLDRTIGAFGNIDSFVYVYRWQAGQLRRTAELNLSQLGIVTPKALAVMHADRAGGDVLVVGAGSAKAVTLRWSAQGVSVLTELDLAPGSVAVAPVGDGYLLANPLLDEWQRLSGQHPSGAEDSDVLTFASAGPLDDGECHVPSPQTRLGEALFFTTLMAPNNSADGPLSRFTCETCHFEGYADGRTHHTGRGQVHATTKPLFGLFNNRPYFTRALDKDLSVMVHSEFRVAGAKSGTSPWFAATAGQTAWFDTAGAAPDSDPTNTQQGPVQLRKALMEFLARNSHRSNPAALQRSESVHGASAHGRFSELEANGAASFARYCESCHQARLVTTQPDSRQSFERWETLVLSSNGPIVWARDGYERTGIEPYVHDKGARPTSLRRLYKKWPYFTNGSARSLSDLLQRIRIDPSMQAATEAGAALPAAAVMHQAAAGDPLAADVREALEAFLRLL